MSNEFPIGEKTRSVLNDILEADGSDFVRLTEIAGLNPSKDFVGADLRGVDFGACDLSGYDFSDADLREARLDRARLEGATFARTQSEGAIWPLARPSEEPYAPRLRRTERYQLHHYQTAIVEAALEAFAQHTPRPMVAMPAGTGKHIVLRALLEALDQRGDLRQALLLSGTRAGMEQLAQALSSEFGTDAVAPIPRATSPSRRPLTQRVILESLNTLRLDRSSKTHPVPAVNGGISHIVIMDEGDLRPRLRMLEQLYPDVPILTFISEPIRRPDSMLEGTLVFSLSYENAVSVGVLRPANVIRRGPLGPWREDATLDIRKTCSDIANTIEDMPRDFVGAVVCKGIEEVQAVASQLQYDLWQSHRRSDQRRIVQHTSASADYSLVNAAIEMPGTILVLTEQTYNRFDWGTVDFVFVLTKLKRPELAAFPRGHRKKELTVFDYLGSFDFPGP